MAVFQFKYFSVRQDHSALKVGTDALLLGAFCNVSNVKRVLDVGAGTGVISLMIAQRLAYVQIDAVDIDVLSLKDCDYNFKQSPWSNKLAAIEADFMEFDSVTPYDLIVSNPPFYLDGLLGQVDRMNKAKHAVHFSFDVFFKQAEKNLNASGEVWIIIPADNLNFIEELAKQAGFFLIHVVRVSPNSLKQANRIVLGFSKKEKRIIATDFVIRNEDGTYSDAYKVLTADFHDRSLP